MKRDHVCVVERSNARAVSNQPPGRSTTTTLSILSRPRHLTRCDYINQKASKILCET